MKPRAESAKELLRRRGMAAREDVNPNGRSLAALYGSSEGASYASYRVPGRFPLQSFSMICKRAIIDARSPYLSNKDLRALYVPHKCRP